MMTHPELGRLLAALVAATGGRTVLEVGTFVGISAAWMAGSLAPDGHLDTLEADPERAGRAERWFAQVGIADRVTVHRGPAADTMARLPDAAYDLCYIDADKAGYPDYLVQAVRLVRLRRRDRGRQRPGRRTGGPASGTGCPWHSRPTSLQFRGARAPAPDHGDPDGGRRRGRQHGPLSSVNRPPDASVRVRPLPQSYGRMHGDVFVRNG